MGRILFVTPYPYDTAGSQRFRFELYYNDLEAAGWQCDKTPFFDRGTWRILYADGHQMAKIMGVIRGFLRRIRSLITLGRYQYIYVHREASPVGPPFFEFIVAKIWRKKMLYDFDDAIWKKDISKANRLMKWLRNTSKVSSICKWSHAVVAGNDYLADHARQYNSNVAIIPTAVDTVGRHNKSKDQTEQPVNIGWTGTHTTLKYLTPLIPVIKELSEEYNFTFYVICDHKPQWDLTCLKFIRWTKENEVRDLLKFHVGLMPLPLDKWAEGKCGFKAIQYLSLGIPTLASKVGVNSIIVKHGESGYLISNESDWNTYLRELLVNQSKRREMGRSGTDFIRSRYSKTALKDKFIHLFHD